MTNTDLETFQLISKKVQEGSLSPTEGEQQIKGLNFLSFDIDQIKYVQEATWLSDEVAVSILKNWMREQDRVLLELRANLVLTPEISKQRLLEFYEASRCPSHEPNLEVKNIIYSLATAAGTREYYNPIKYQLITYKINTDVERFQKSFVDLFENEPGHYYLSSPHQDEYFIITLPPFLKVQITSYTIGAPPQLNQKAQGGIQSWHLQGSNDEVNWTSIDIQNEDQHLLLPDSVHEYTVMEPKGFFRSFKLTNLRPNHQGTLSIIIGKFDINGKLLISSN